MELVAHHVPAAEARVVNVNGAGDCLAAAFAAAVALGVDEVEAVAMGVAAGSVAVSSSSNVPSQAEGLDWRRLQAAARPLLQQAVRMTVPVAAAL
jgi:sugar/nucleoside kinase (ribokinase family)